MIADRNKTREKPHPVDRHVGSRLYLRRSLMKITQKSLGNSLGLSFQQIQKYERGATRISASRLFHISCALDVPVSWFFEDMPEKLKASCNHIYPGLAHDDDMDQTRLFVRQDIIMLACHYDDIPDKNIQKDMVRLMATIWKAFNREETAETAP